MRTVRTAAALVGGLMTGLAAIGGEASTTGGGNPSSPERAAASFAGATKTLTAARGRVAVAANAKRVRFVSRGGVLVVR